MIRTTDPLRTYLSTVSEQLAALTNQEETIDAAAEAIAASIVADGLLHVFGTGHSHLIAAELFYRAGGLGAVNPVLIEGLLLHAGAELSTSMERTPGLGRIIFDRMNAKPTDTLLVVSNSGANIISRELVGLAREHGMTTIALVSRAHAASRGAGSAGTAAPGIDALADIVLDNGGIPGDAAIEVEGVDQPMGPTSTVLGTAIANILAMAAAQKVAARGVAPDVFTSSNVPGGDEANTATLDRYRDRVRSL